MDANMFSLCFLHRKRTVFLRILEYYWILLFQFEPLNLGSQQPKQCFAGQKMEAFSVPPTKVMGICRIMLYKSIVFAYSAYSSLGGCIRTYLILSMSTSWITSVYIPRLIHPFFGYLPSCWRYSHICWLKALEPNIDLLNGSRKMNKHYLQFILNLLTCC